MTLAFYTEPQFSLVNPDTVYGITYTNNSPDNLDVLWLQLDQNLYRTDSRGYAMGGGRRINPKQHTEGYEPHPALPREQQPAYRDCRRRHDDLPFAVDPVCHAQDQQRSHRCGER